MTKLTRTNFKQLNHQHILNAHLECIRYSKLDYAQLTIATLRNLPTKTGVQLQNKSAQLFFVRRKAIVDNKNERILESSVSYEVENGFGDIVLSGNAQSVYTGLCVLTDSDVPF